MATLDQQPVLALLEWLNSFSLPATLRSMKELADGSVLWDVLQDIDSSYFLGSLPERSSADHWVPRWQNLKHVHKMLISYIRAQNEGEIPAGLNTTPDLKAVAEASSVKETCELLKCLLFAAISSPNAEAHIVTMQGLSTTTQEGLKNIIQEAQIPSEERLVDLQNNRHNTAPPASDDVVMDPELRFEERVGKVIAENEKLSHDKKELEKGAQHLSDRLNQLQEQNETLQDQLASTEDRLTALKSGKGDILSTAKGIGSRHHDEIIATQEAKLSTAQDEIDKLQMSLESMRVKNQRYQKLQDDYDELKTDRDQLSRKANAAEKYRQKLQLSQDFEKENFTLKKKVKDLEQQIKDSDLSQKATSERDIELEEYRQLIPKIEQDRHEIQNIKKQLEFDNHALKESLESAEDQIGRDENIIAELRERTREMEETSVISGAQTPTRERSNTFHGDLEALTVKGDNQLHLENEELRKEIEKLKGEQSKEEMDSERLPLTENETCRRLHQELLIAREQLADAEAQLGATERKLADSRKDLELVDKNKLEVVREIRAANGLELRKMRKNWDSLQRKIRELEGRLGASHLIVSDVSNECDSLRNLLSTREAQIQNEEQATLEQMRSIYEEITSLLSGKDGMDANASNLFKKFGQVTRQGMEVLAKRAFHIHQQNEIITTLLDRVSRYEEDARESGKEVEEKKREAELRQVIQRQTREISLISSAWHDQQSRYHNTQLSMPRLRHPAHSGTAADIHRSWLAKQRAIIIGSSGVDTQPPLSPT